MKIGYFIKRKQNENRQHLINTAYPNKIAQKTSKHKQHGTEQEKNKMKRQTSSTRRTNTKFRKTSKNKSHKTG